MAVQTVSPDETMDAIKYLKLISPPPEGDEVPWFTAMHKDGLLMLWEAVRRLELIAHHDQSGPQVGGPVIAVDKRSSKSVLTGDEAMATKNPPPPPPPPRWHHGPIVPPRHR
jgi:hypothetical protein